MLESCQNSVLISAIAHSFRLGFDEASSGSSYSEIQAQQLSSNILLRLSFSDAVVRRSRR